jgi:hypothetical protein
MVREDGALVSMCHDPDQQITAFSRHVTQGAFESVAVIPGPDRDEVWAVVRRTAGGAERRYVEQFQSLDFEEQEDAFFVDSGLTFYNAAAFTGASKGDPVVVTAPGHGFADGDQVYVSGVLGMEELNGRVFTVADAEGDTFALAGEDGTEYGEYAGGGLAEETRRTFSGLGHLEGAGVCVLADGAVRPEAVVSGGGITLASPARKVHAGLGYTALLSTMRLEAGGQGGTAQGRPIRAFKAAARLYRTLGLEMGPDFSRMDTLPFRSPAHAMDRPPELFSGDKEMEFRGGYGKELRVCLRQSAPLPFTVTALMPGVQGADG